MQRRQETIISSTKRGFNNKIAFWKYSMIRGDFLKFFTFFNSTVGKLSTDKLQKLIIEHLALLEEKVNNYFPLLTTNTDWILLPFDFAEKLDLNNDNKNEFIGLWSNSTQQIIFSSQKKFLTFFYLSLGEYPEIFKKTIFLLLLFSTSTVMTNKIRY